MAADLSDVIQAINAGDRESAKKLLREVLKDDPNADAWYIASRLASGNQQKIKRPFEKSYVGLDLCLPHP